MVEGPKIPNETSTLFKRRLRSAAFPILLSAVAALVALQAAPVDRQATVVPSNRVALVIGNSSYQQLRTLRNAESDARSIDDALRKLGYETRLVIDATGDRLRQEMRQFTGDSAGADLALVFYAGHGAQLNGSNYLLPVDMEPPRFESDIGLDGVKVDDIVNTLRSRTKVLFLDACRDNPALFKNVSQGRGADTVGLAPANSSSADRSSAGGGLFIAYAADSGQVAADGIGAHSPFTDALLRHVDKPISIDDLFTLVTREVRLTTNNTQRPYKYASLDSIVCLAGTCATAPAAPPTGLQQAAQRSDAEDYKVALEAGDPVAALRGYLDKYPESPNRDDALRTLSRYRRFQFLEWTYVGSTLDRVPYYMQLGSVQEDNGHLVHYRVKSAALESLPAGATTWPAGAYRIDWEVSDCTRLVTGVAESEVFNESGNRLWRYKWANPDSLDWSQARPLEKGSPRASLRYLACNEALRTPLIDKTDFIGKFMLPFASTPSGDGDMYYLPERAVEFEAEGRKRHWREAVTVSRLHNDSGINTWLDHKMAQDIPYRQVAELYLFDCETSRAIIVKQEFYDADWQLSFWLLPNQRALEKDTQWYDVAPNSPTGIVQKMVCSLGAEPK